MFPEVHPKTAMHDVFLFIYLFFIFFFIFNQ